MGESCDVCCEPMEVAALGSCDHVVCVKCMLRMRSLYGLNTCCVCRQEMATVLCVMNRPRLVYDNLKSCVIPEQSAFLSADVRFLDRAALKYADDLFARRCRVCEVVCGSMDTLQAHMKKQHDRYFCPLCLDSRKQFLCELDIFTYAGLTAHLRPPKPGSSERRVHAWCGFCSRSLYDDQELLTHNREKHEVCTVCSQQGVSSNVYKDYSDLEQHYRNAHYLCEEGDCSRGHAVFGSEVDYRAHMLQTHASKEKKMSRTEQRNAMKLDVNHVSVNYEPIGAPRRHAAGSASSAYRAPAPAPSSAHVVPSSAAVMSPSVPVPTLSRAQFSTSVQLYLGKKNYAEFKSLTTQCRKGSITVVQFYDAVGRFFGEYAEVFFWSIVEQLPDPVLRANLTKVNATRGEGWAPQQRSLDELLDFLSEEQNRIDGSSYDFGAGSQSSMYSAPSVASDDVYREPAEEFPALPSATAGMRRGVWSSGVQEPARTTEEDFPSLPIRPVRKTARQKRKDGRF